MELLVQCAEHACFEDFAAVDLVQVAPCLAHDGSVHAPAFMQCAAQVLPLCIVEQPLWPPHAFALVNEPVDAPRKRLKETMRNSLYMIVYRKNVKKCS
jgi:hypothetical protein